MRPSFGTKTGATNHEHSLMVDIGPVDKSKPMVCIESKKEMYFLEWEDRRCM